MSQSHWAAPHWFIPPYPVYMVAVVVGSTRFQKQALSSLQVNSLLVYWSFRSLLLSHPFGILFTSLISIWVYFPFCLSPYSLTHTVVNPSSTHLLIPPLSLYHTDIRRAGEEAEEGGGGKRIRQCGPPSSSSLLTSLVFPAPPSPCWNYIVSHHIQTSMSIITFIVRHHHRIFSVIRLVTNDGKTDRIHIRNCNLKVGPPTFCRLTYHWPQKCFRFSVIIEICITINK